MRKPAVFSRSSWKTLSVMPLPILNTPSVRPSPRLTLSTLSSARAALCMVLEVKFLQYLLMNAKCCFFYDNCYWQTFALFPYQVLSAHSVNFSISLYLSPHCINPPMKCCYKVLKPVFCTNFATLMFAT
jgi:hypothetical protein